jgi:hypothetical protein
VRAWKEGHQEVFLPLSHPAGEAQVDFGEATVKLHGALAKVAMFVMTLPYRGAIFMQVFPRECTETFLEGHRQAFEFFGDFSNSFLQGSLQKKTLRSLYSVEHFRSIGSPHTTHSVCKVNA